MTTVRQAFEARLKRRIAANPQLYQRYKSDTTSTRLFELIKGTSFWRWDLDVDTHKQLYKGGKCRCFNCLLPAGWPKKNGIENPLFSYQKEIIYTLEHYRTLYLLKAGGIGASELFLRYMAWLCLRDGSLSNSQMVIITGPRVQLSISLIDRMKKLFYPSVVFDSKETVIELNKTRIEAFPSHSIESARGLPNVSFILADESDFWNTSEEQDVRAVIERYGPKSHPFIALISTANRPDGLMDTIRKEPEETCLYKRLFMDYRVGLGLIYTEQEIDQARKSPSFESEFCLKFQGQIGNLFSQLAIDKAVELGRLYDPDKDYNPTARHCIGIDCAFGGSSNFAITVLQAQNSKIQVLYSEEFSRPDYDSMLHHVIALMKQYHKVYTIRVDAANPEFIASLKAMLGERRDFNEHIATLKKQNPHTPIERFMRVIPVSFNIEHRRMLSVLKAFIEDDRGLLQINPRFTELIMSLRSAVAEETSLIKKESLYTDSLDSMRLALSYFVYSPEGASK